MSSRNIRFLFTVLLAALFLTARPAWGGGAATATREQYVSFRESHPLIAPADRSDQKGPWLSRNWGFLVMAAGVTLDWHSTRTATGRPGVREMNGLYVTDGRFDQKKYWALNAPILAGWAVARRYMKGKNRNVTEAAYGGVRLAVAARNYNVR
jgi:hypothetical protein